MLQLSCKFGESKWNPYWVIPLTSSSGTNHVPNEHEDFDQYDPNAMNIRDNTMLEQVWKFDGPNWNPRWLIVLASSPGTNNVLNGHEDLDQYGLVHLLDNPIGSLC